MDDRDAVPGCVHIELDGVRAIIESSNEGRKRVLGVSVSNASMSDRFWSARGFLHVVAR